MGKRVRHFNGRESSKQLEFIDELHKLGLNTTIELPELVVVGDQDTGKSSVLQAITEISFPIKEEMCTRFPIQISFRQASESEGSGVKVTILPGKRTEEDDAFRERIKDFSMEVEELTTEVMGEIIMKATERIFGEGKLSEKTLSDAILRIERFGPDEMHWTIIDLPGLVRDDQCEGTQSESNMKISASLTRKYLSNERNIVLAVIDDTDVGRQDCLRLIRKDPKAQGRCIGVLTKCDKRQEGAGFWMVKLLQNELSTVPHLDHGWFALRNRAPIEANVSDAARDENEAKEFERPVWEGVPEGRTGIKSLVEYVDRERRAQIQLGMPNIIEEIRQKLRECEESLRKMGEARDTPGAQRSFIVQFCNEMQKMTQAVLRSQYKDLDSNDQKVQLRPHIRQSLQRFITQVGDPDKVKPKIDNYENDLIDLCQNVPTASQWLIAVQSNDGIYGEICKEAARSLGRGLPGTVHPDVEERIFYQQSAHWGGYARTAVEDAKRYVLDCREALLRIAIPNSRVRLEVMRVVDAQREEWSKNVDNALEELIDDNRTGPVQSYNHLFDQRCHELHETRTRVLKLQLNGASEEFGYVPPTLTQVLFTRERLESYYCIALPRFIDNVTIQVIERHVLGPQCPLRAIAAETFAKLDDQELNQVAGEDAADVRCRQRLEMNRRRYKEALSKWEQLRML